MKLSFKNNFWGYFNFYYQVIGNKLIAYLGLCVLISFMDGLGLAMFIPLLQLVSNKDGATGGEESLGSLHYLTDFVQSLGFELNLTTVLGMMTILFVAKGMLKYAQLSYYAMLKQLFTKKVRYNLVNNLHGLSYSAFLKLDAGKIQNTLTTEVGRLHQTLVYYFSASQAFVMLATYIVLAFLSNYQFAILVGLGAGLSNFIYRRLYKKTKRASIELTTKGSDFNGYLIQAINYFKYLKSTNTFTDYSKKLKSVITETEQINRRIGNLNAIAASIKEPVIITIVSLVILAQVNWVGSSLDSIILSLLLFYRALTYLVMCQSYWQLFIEYSGGMNAVATMTEQMSGLQEKPGSVVYKGFKKQLFFKDVVFHYDESKKALNNINIKIPAKQTIALIGESGSGKTTIANMIAGLFMPNKGQIYVDDQPLREYDLNTYRSKIGYISQESVIFNDNIYNNITFWAEPTPENIKRFNKVVEMASLGDFLNALPEKEKTRLGDNGILISGGQKQRISIARELFKDADILILDEATSALDSETEKIIQENIEKLHGHYTMVLIAHRLSTIKEADIIYLLEDGEVSAAGSFDEMIHKSSRFQKMVSLQAV